MSQQYRKLRGIRDFNKLVPKFMQQKRFEEQQKALGIEGTKRQLRKMGPSAVNAREFRLTGKRGMPDLRVSLTFLTRPRRGCALTPPLALSAVFLKTGRRKTRNPKATGCNRKHWPRRLRLLNRRHRTRRSSSRWEEKGTMQPSSHHKSRPKTLTVRRSDPPSHLQFG